MALLVNVRYSHGPSLNKMSSYRDKLIQYRRRLSSAKLMIGVSPISYLDLIFNPFSILEWN